MRLNCASPLPHPFLSCSVTYTSLLPHLHLTFTCTHTRHLVRSAKSTLQAGLGQAWFAYMGPEAFNQALGPVSASMDVYSLALLIWTMLVGRRPWEGEGLDDLGVLHQVCSGKGQVYCTLRSCAHAA